MEIVIHPMPAGSPQLSVHNLPESFGAWYTGLATEEGLRDPVSRSYPPPTTIQLGQLEDRTTENERYPYLMALWLAMTGVWCAQPLSLLTVKAVIDLYRVDYPLDDNGHYSYPHVMRDGGWQKITPWRLAQVLISCVGAEWSIRTTDEGWNAFEPAADGPET